MIYHKIKNIARFCLTKFGKPLYKTKLFITSVRKPQNDSALASKLNDYNLCRPYGAKRQICYVANNNVAFFRDGKALACSYNQTYEFGNCSTQSIKEIFEGEKRKKFIAAHRQNDLSIGCRYCRDFIVSGKYNGLKSMTFDRYANRKRIYPAVIEFDISSHCNLRCIMCNERNRSQVPNENIYNESFIEEITPYLKHIKEAKFYGGEPFMIKQYYKIWNIITHTNPNTKIFVITNGTILNEEIKKILNRGKFEIAVSVDSLNKEKFEKIRKGAKFETVIKNLHWFNNYCKQKNTTLSVSMTIFRENWQDIPDILEFCNRNNCSVFFSYLYKPEDFSLWTLPEQELKSIADYLSGFHFTKKNAIEIYNAKCYDEIKDHLKYWTNPPDPQIEFENKLLDYFNANNENNRKSDPASKTKEFINYISMAIEDLGYHEQKSKIFKELKNIDIDHMIKFYQEHDKNELYEKMQEFFKDFKKS
jgi:MoaA/NifB/PqqE/SkfB family radical SAM enzyme